MWRDVKIPTLTRSRSNEEKNMQSGKGKFWRRRGGSSRMSMMSNVSSDSKILVDVEEEFLHAAEFGDIPTVRRLLTDNNELNIDCIDALGRTALRLAVKNEHLEVVEVLLEKSSGRHIYEAVLQAISAGHVQIAETILKHKRYMEMWKERKKLGDDDHFFKTQFEESQFSPDMTPLILAAQKNQYEIVQLLLLRGETIQKPHKYNCLCQECSNKRKFDQLRSAKYRLNAYRGLASEAYISLSSKDPVLTAFQLGHELKQLSTIEKYFKMEYCELADQLSEYVVKILDRVRTQDELELVLNKIGKASSEKYETLGRLKLALTYREKKFVAHPSCQQRLVRSWYQGIEPFLKAGLARRILIAICLLFVYPFLVIIFLFNPNAKIVRGMKFPCVKFGLNTLSFLVLLTVIVVSTVESSYLETYRLSRTYPDVYEKYIALRNNTGWKLFGEDIPIRHILPLTSQLLISVWVLGNLVQECRQLYTEGAKLYCQSYFNIMDFCLITVYTVSFTLRYLVIFKVHTCLDYIRQHSVSELEADERGPVSFYWLTADRYYWSTWDPVNLAEGLFAMANVLTCGRVSYLLPANETLGPLQISLGRMVLDILKFLVLVFVVMGAFIIGAQNLFWYYNVRENIELEKRNFTVNAQESFGDFIKAFRTMFWSLFGRGESSAVELNEYNNHVTEDIGYWIYGSYNIAMVTVLLNMLIAMMARSFQAINEDADVEWKYSRSQLYIDYIGNDFVLPVPLNILTVPRSIVGVIIELCCPCCDSEDSDNEALSDANQNNSFSAIGNGVEAGGLSGATAVDIYEANVTEKTDSRHRKPLSQPIEDKKTYQKVMQRIIQRYIFDIQREAEVTEDDFEEIKQDISSFRYEILNLLKSRESANAEMQICLNSIQKHVLTLREELHERGGLSHTGGDLSRTFLKQAADKLNSMPEMHKRSGSLSKLARSFDESEETEGISNNTTE